MKIAEVLNFRTINLIGEKPYFCQKIICYIITIAYSLNHVFRCFSIIRILFIKNF
jgi:hypothetical protein